MMDFIESPVYDLKAGVLAIHSMQSSRFMSSPMFIASKFIDVSNLGLDFFVCFGVSSETPNLKWSILSCVPPYSKISKKCLLRLYEKLKIVTYQNQKKLFNKRSEFLCKCRHANKFLLKNYTENDFR